MKIELTCRVCGKKYEACESFGERRGVMDWHAVACSPECGEEYFRKIAESRRIAEAVAETTKTSGKKSKKKTTE